MNCERCGKEIPDINDAWEPQAIIHDRHELELLSGMPDSLWCSKRCTELAIDQYKDTAEYEYALEREQPDGY